MNSANTADQMMKMTLEGIQVAAEIGLKAGGTAAKSRFLFSMSHDIRTPMNAIMGYTELMEKNVGNIEKEKDYLSKIRCSSTFLLDLINSILEMARIESGKETLNIGLTSNLVTLL